MTSLASMFYISTYTAEISRKIDLLEFVSQFGRESELKLTKDVSVLLKIYLKF